MKIIKFAFPAIFFLAACTANTVKTDSPSSSLPLAGTWQLISGTTIEKNDTTITDYTQKISFIKIINADHFAFLKHDLNKGKDTATAAFVAGGGRYSLRDSVYTEHLEYCSDRQWEGNDFSFTVTIKNDTLVQTGIEKVENAGINRLNTEKYARVKNK
jgi:hypothetical protein